MQMEIEEAALKKEDDTLSKERLEALQKELAELKDPSTTTAKRSGITRRRCRREPVQS